MRIAFSSLSRNIKASPTVSRCGSESIRRLSIFVSSAALVWASVCWMQETMVSKSSSGGGTAARYRSSVCPQSRSERIISMQALRTSSVFMPPIVPNLIAERKDVK